MIGFFSAGCPSSCPSRTERDDSNQAISPPSTLRPPLFSPHPPRSLLSLTSKTPLTPSATDNAKFASCGGDRAVFLWDVASGAVVRRLQGHFGKVYSVAFSGDGGVLASGEYGERGLEIRPR
jgi:WD40 repeat protein